MNISELRSGQDKVDVEGTVTDISEPRQFNKFGRDIRVATATLEDSSGSIKLSLWNQDIEKVKVGDTVKITNGFVKDFQGENQLTSGKFGKLEVLTGESKKESKEGKKEPEIEEETEELEEESEEF